MKKKEKPSQESTLEFNSYWPSDRKVKNNQIVFYIITRAEIENCFTDRLIHDLRISADNPLVGYAHGNMSFLVDGYNDDPRELPQIPEFVRFMRKVAESNPCWIYFTMPETNWLNYVLSACGSIGELDADLVNRVITVALVNRETAAFFLRQSGDYQRLCQLGGVDGKAQVEFLQYTTEHYLPGCGRTLTAMMMAASN